MVHGCEAYVYYGFEISKEDCHKVLDIIDPNDDIDIHSIYQIEPKNLKYLKKNIDFFKDLDIKKEHFCLKNFSYYVFQQVNVDFVFGKNDSLINKMLFERFYFEFTESEKEEYRKWSKFYNFSAFGPVCLGIEEINQVTAKPLEVPELSDEFKTIVEELEKIGVVCENKWYFRTIDY